MVSEHDPGSTDVSADEALQRLVSGNERFATGKARWAGMSPAELSSQASRQRPFATVIGCSDARVPPELIFDAVLGELFVVRVAGNVFSPEIAGSLQYAGAHLRTSLFLVLGHTGCGAVSAALKLHRDRALSGTRIRLLAEAILPAIESLPLDTAPGKLLDAAVEANVRLTISHVIASADERSTFGTSDFRLVGGIYDLHTGRVRFLGNEVR